MPTAGWMERESLRWCRSDSTGGTGTTLASRAFKMFAATTGQTIMWWNAYFFHMRKWRNAYQRVGGDRWRTTCVLWLAAVKIGGGDGDAEQTWVVIWAMNRTQQERCRWVEISPKAPKICVVNVTYNSHWQFDFTYGYVHWTVVRSVVKRDAWLLTLCNSNRR